MVYRFNVPAPEAENSTDSITKTCGTTTNESTPKRPPAETAAPSHRTTAWVSPPTDVRRLI
ncbi:hypothetical protein PENPOL_c014G08865 [Penicillium polonicum]|uniref:Uncharacterized protein n=1 Tax=Penicillium polonicum TaxID=60169 RepID=A0A1V6NC36_PENPO|nr:hypothetical protein PENPOL_c014G08865 [Penicillium polonicum]